MAAGDVPAIGHFREESAPTPSPAPTIARRWSRLGRVAKRAGARHAVFASGRSSAPGET